MSSFVCTAEDKPHHAPRWPAGCIPSRSRVCVCLAHERCFVKGRKGPVRSVSFERRSLGSAHVLRKACNLNSHHLLVLVMGHIPTWHSMAPRKRPVMSRHSNRCDQHCFGMEFNGLKEVHPYAPLLKIVSTAVSTHLH